MQWLTCLAEFHESFRFSDLVWNLLEIKALEVILKHFISLIRKVRAACRIVLLVLNLRLGSVCMAALSFWRKVGSLICTGGEFWVELLSKAYRSFCCLLSTDWFSTVNFPCEQWMMPVFSTPWIITLNCDLTFTVWSITSLINSVLIVNHQLRGRMVHNCWIMWLKQNLKTNCLILGRLPDSLSSTGCKWIKSRSKVFWGRGVVLWMVQ